MLELDKESHEVHRCPGLTIIRRCLPTPDAVIVRFADGHTMLVADERLPDSLVNVFAAEAHDPQGEPVALG